MKLKKNQILITRSEDGHVTSIKIGDMPTMGFSSCPDRPYEDIGDSIREYITGLGLEKTPEWQGKGCWHKGTGNCNSCN